MSKLKSNLKYLRKRKGFDLTQKELAEAIGVTVVTIYQIENGRGANIRTAKKLADYFSCNIEDLFDWE